MNGARNAVVHSTTFALEESETEVIATNRFRHMPKDVKNLILKPEELYALAKDAQTISAVLIVAEAENRKPGSAAKLSAEMAIARPPWHYKPPKRRPLRRKEK